MPQPGTPCRLCRCAAYLVEQDVGHRIPSLTHVGCVCGHNQSEHASHPRLAPRRCGIGGMFVTPENEPTVRSRCSRCQDLYFMHLLVEDGPSPAAQTPSCGSATPTTASSAPNSGTTMVATRLQSYLQPSASPLGSGTVSSLPPPLGNSSSSMVVPTWSRPGPPPIGSVNDCRMSSAATARGVPLSPFGTFPSRVAPIPTSLRTVSVGAASSNRNARTRHRTTAIARQNYLVIIHPEPPFGEYCSTVSDDRFRTLRSTTQNKVNAFVAQMHSLNLCFTIDCTAEDETPAAPVIHEHLNSHLTQHNFEYTSSPNIARSSSGPTIIYLWCQAASLQYRPKFSYACDVVWQRFQVVSTWSTVFWL
ncbi:hypothetical protein EV363DRAFT_1396338 [Boletus edulis]|nr:hypothetical protein EV363DRAFT_1396338 [Boletus edulis]